MYLCLCLPCALTVFLYLCTYYLLWNMSQPIRSRQTTYVSLGEKRALAEVLALLVFISNNHFLMDQVSTKPRLNSKAVFLSCTLFCFMSIEINEKVFFLISGRTWQCEVTLPPSSDPDFNLLQHTHICTHTYPYTHPVERGKIERKWTSHCAVS